MEPVALNTWTRPVAVIVESVLLTDICIPQMVYGDHGSTCVFSQKAKEVGFNDSWIVSELGLPQYTPQLMLLRPAMQRTICLKTGKAANRS